MTIRKTAQNKKLQDRYVMSRKYLNAKDKDGVGRTSETIKECITNSDGLTISEIAQMTAATSETIKECIAGMDDIIIKVGLRYHVRGLFRCITCEAGPWSHGSVGSNGIPIESYHDGHKLKNLLS